MAIRIKIAAEYDQKGLKTAQKELADFGDKAKKAFAAVGVAALAVGVGLAKFGADSIAAAENVAQADNRLKQVANSMNLFGAETDKVAQRLINFAEKNEVLVGVDGEVIKAAQAKLLTFKNLARTADEMGGEFDRATMAALDLAAAGFGSAESNAVQLGKALQDPIKGITALTRSGVTFTQEEKNKIRVLVESGKTLEAQNMILSAIETQVGGTAQATAKASDKMKLAFENINEAVGAALLPTFELFAEEITKLTPELENALAPAAAEIADIFRKEVLPALQDFTKWLASPQGTQTLKDLAQAVVDSIKNFIDFVIWVNKNKDALLTLGGVIAGLVITYKTITTATALWQAAIVVTTTKINAATGATTALATATKLLPWAALITAGVFAVATLTNYADAVYGSKINTEGLTEAQIKEQRQLESLKRQLGQYEYALKNATEGNKELAEDGVKKTRNEIAILETRIKGATGEMARFNNLKLTNLRKEIINTAGELNRFRNIQNKFVAAYDPSLENSGGGGGGGGGGGETAREKALRERQEAFKKVQSLIRSAQKDIAEAQAEYAETIRNLEAENAKEIARIRTDFGERLADIAKKSRARLTDAFRGAATISLSDLFEVDEARSVANLVNGLTTKLKGARDLIANAAALSAAGFSQTFIEQIVSAGTTTGNEMAAAILASTPETQAELKNLFSAIEDTANNGMNSLAQEIYDKQGLATQELRDLYTTTQIELSEALLEQQVKFGKSLDDARNKLVKSLETIREKLREDLAEMDGYFGGLGKTVDAFMDKLDDLIEKYKALSFDMTVPGAEVPVLPVEPVAPVIDTAALEKIRTLIKNAETWLTKNLSVFERIRAEDVLEIYKGLEKDIMNAVRIDLSGIRSGMSVEDLVQAAKAAGGQSINNFYLEVYADSRTSGAVAGQEVVEKLEAFTRANGGGGGLLWQVL